MLDPITNSNSYPFETTTYKHHLICSVKQSGVHYVLTYVQAHSTAE